MSMNEDVQAGMRLQKNFTRFYQRIEKLKGKEMTTYRVRSILTRAKNLERSVKEIMMTKITKEQADVPSEDRTKQ